MEKLTGALIVITSKCNIVNSVIKLLTEVE